MIFIIMVDNALSIFNKSASIVDNLINGVDILNRHVECYPQKSQYFQHGSCIVFDICHARTPSVSGFSTHGCLNPGMNSLLPYQQIQFAYETCQQPSSYSTIGVVTGPHAMTDWTH